MQQKPEELTHQAKKKVLVNLLKLHLPLLQSVLNQILKLKELLAVLNQILKLKELLAVLNQILKLKELLAVLNPLIALKKIKPCLNLIAICARPKMVAKSLLRLKPTAKRLLV